MFGGFNNFKGKEVVVYVSNGYGTDVEEIRGVVKSQLGGAEDATMLYLENGIVINCKFIIKIEVKE